MLIVCCSFKRELRKQTRNVVVGGGREVPYEAL